MTAIPVRPKRFRGILIASLLLAPLGCGADPASADPLEETGPCPASGAGITLGGIGLDQDASATPTRRLVLMGGGGEDDTSSTLFAEAAGGGDLLILRATGSTTSYPSYFLTTLSPSPRPASAVTVRTDIPGSGDDPGVLCRVGVAEAIWLAGGDQWDYLGGWPATLHGALAQHTSGGGAVGGTSAGAVSLGEAAFDARLGTVTSPEALADPLRPEVSLSFPTFSQPELRDVLVDSHFTERNREGRLLVFLARFLVEKEKPRVVGVGLDEGVALVLEEGGFRVFGPEGGAVWAYELEGPATLTSGAPLSLEGITRVRLDVGSEGAWPLDFASQPGVSFRVVDGILAVG